MAKVPRPRWLSTFLFPFASRFLDVDGCRLHYVDEGRGPVLLMLHGSLTWSFLYRNVIRGLAGRFRCIALDCAGFGLSSAAPGFDFRPVSQARLVAQVIRRLDLKRVTLMAHEWGGPIGLHVAGANPDRFRALVLSHTWAWPIDGGARLAWLSRLAGGRLGGFLVHRLNALAVLLGPGGVGSRRLPPEVLAAYRGPWTTPETRLPMQVLARELLDHGDFLAVTASRLAALAHLPTLLVWGGFDPTLGRRERRRFESTFGVRSTVVLAENGPYPHEDAPDEVVAAVRGFWGQRMEVS